MAAHKVSGELRRLCQPDLPRRTAAEAVHAITAVLAGRLRPEVAPVLVPILRAGAAMLPAACDVLDHPQVCWVRCSKHKITRTVTVTWASADRLPPGSAVLLDVVVARGDTIAALLRHLRARGYRGPAHLLTCYAAPEGVDHLRAVDPDLRILAGRLADTVDASGYVIPPTYGDMGDKLYGPIDAA